MFGYDDGGLDCDFNMHTEGDRLDREDADFGIEADEVDAWEDDDFEDDGQPSELTEWLDFDPDC